ncbi:hypothetical protein ACHWQZ_G011935 [Mnemiopsis leidyi]
MITLLALTAAFTTIVNSNNIFSDFASSICQQRHELNGDVVCQPDGEFAARQCSASTGFCYCATETGEVIEGTSYSKDKDYVCRNVLYDVEYKHQRRNAGFDIQDMLSEENQLTKKLLKMDKTNAVWEMRSIVITEHASDANYRVFEAVLAGYNTRLSEEEVVKKVRNVLGSESDHLRVIEIYNSVHSGECPMERSGCNEDAKLCFSDSECEVSEVCCETECDHRCVSFLTGATSPTFTGTTEEMTSPLGDGTSGQTGEWYSTTGTDGSNTQPLFTETEVLTTDWSTTDFTEEIGTTEQVLTTDESTTLVTEELEMTSTGSTATPEKSETFTSEAVTEDFAFSSSATEEGEIPTSTQPDDNSSTEESRFPSTEEDSTSEETVTPSFTEKTVTTSASLETDFTSEVPETRVTQDIKWTTEYATSFVNSLFTEELSDGSTGIPDETSTDSLPAESTVETKFTTDVTGFEDSTTSPGAGGTDALSFKTTSPKGSDSMTYYTQELTAFTGDASSETVELDLSEITGTPGTTQPIVTSNQMMSLCEQEASQAINEGRDGPLCLESGNYSPQQCDSKRDICWCVDDQGLELKGSRRYGSADCDNFRVTTPPMTTTEPMSDCWKAYSRAVKQQAYDRGVMLPTCQPNGLYAKSQCQGTFCWCVDEMNGVMVNGTRKPGPIDCDLFLEGVCPEYARHHDNVCINKCDSDDSCYGTTKCCQTHCGRDCVYPQRPENLKKGQCPAPQSLNTVFEQCSVDCKTDQECEGSGKCCFNGCGYTCSAPIYDTNTYCKKVDYLHKGTIEDPRDQYTEGDVLRLSCDHGYQLQGHQQIRCLASGQWEHDLPVCKRISCGVPGSGQFMVVRGSDYFVGGVVTYHCYSGYELQGNSTATCLLSGRWDSEPPSCQRVQCPEMNELPYGRVYGNLMTYGNRIGFRCDYGYTLVGSEQRLCLSDGTWSGTDPTCVRGYFSRTRRHKFMQNDEGSEVGGGKCQYGTIDTIDYNGECIEEVLTINCQCGEPESVEQKVKVLCQRGENEFIERTVKIGKDCSCCL